MNKLINFKNFILINENNNLENIIKEYENILEKYNPPFKYNDYTIDNQKENKGVIKFSVFITYKDVDEDIIKDLENNYDKYETDFIKNTDFDEVEILSSDTDKTITYSINIYDYDI